MNLKISHVNKKCWATSIMNFERSLMIPQFLVFKYFVTQISKIIRFQKISYRKKCHSGMQNKLWVFFFLQLTILLFIYRLYFLEEFQVCRKIEEEIQRVPMSPLSPHCSPHLQVISNVLLLSNVFVSTEESRCPLVGEPINCGVPTMEYLLSSKKK